jgi:hypothetical protein
LRAGIGGRPPWGSGHLFPGAGTPGLAHLGVTPMCLVRPLVPTAGFEPCRSGPGAAPLTTAPRRLLIDTVLAPPYLSFGTSAPRRRERIRKLLDRRLLRGVWRRWIRDGFGGGGFAKRVWRRWIRFETGLEAVDSFRNGFGGGGFATGGFEGGGFARTAPKSHGLRIFSRRLWAEGGPEPV